MNTDVGSLKDPLLIFVHGGPGLDEYLEGIFAVPLRSVGLSTLFYEQSKRVSVSTLVEQLASVIKSASSEKVLLVGHSWGMALALETVKQLDANQYKRICGLVMMDGFVSSECEAAFSSELQRLGLSESYTAEDIFLSQEDRKDPSLRAYLSKVMASLDQDSLTGSVNEYIKNLDLKPFIRKLRIPTLVIFGERDVRVPAAYQREFASIIRNAETVEIPNAGHFPFLQRTDLAMVTAKLKEFVLVCSNMSSQE